MTCRLDDMPWREGGLVGATTAARATGDRPRAGSLWYGHDEASSVNAVRSLTVHESGNVKVGRNVFPSRFDSTGQVVRRLLGARALRRRA